MIPDKLQIQGLTDQEVAEARKAHGENKLLFKKENRILELLKSLAGEPMVVLLLITSVIYFIMGSTGDAIFLAAAIVLVSAISIYQDSRSRNALDKLKNFTKATARVIRNGNDQEIPTEELVMGDCLIIEEGSSVPADGIIIHSNDFSVNESVLTGESLSVYKDMGAENNQVFMGTQVASGLAIVQVTAIGNSTQLGAIGKSLEAVETETTPLERQIQLFVKKMVIIGVVVFLIVWGINYTHSHQLADSLIKALTLAMSILPEEIPVAFTTFMALGAWRLMKMGIVVKQMKTVETLGSASVICTDKTGTLTENRMQLAGLYLFPSGQTLTDTHQLDENAFALVTMAMWSSEPIPFDPMEQALHEAYVKAGRQDERQQYHMIHEYPLSGKPPMMTHIFENASGHRIIAAKGAPEAIMAVSDLTDSDRQQITEALQSLAVKGYRVLGVGSTAWSGHDFPATQQEFRFHFHGLVAFYDPPKHNIAEVLQGFYRAGIAVKIITGDNAATTGAIARQIGFKHDDVHLSGDALMQIPDAALPETAANTYLFTRMYPEAKLRIIQALKARQEIVAMTGDGVNDGPALKAAHIGIAMGKKGTEIAKQAASLILVEDDLAKMLDAVAMGRKIYANLKKAIQYIISIHIPIILTVFIPLALGWIYPNIFTPMHVIFLELIMGPTCSIVYENEPMEANTMQEKPRPFTDTFFSWRELATSVVQGLAITAGTLSSYQYAVSMGMTEDQTRSLVFITLIAANILLTLVNRSFYYSFLHTIGYRNKLIRLVIGITVLLTALLLMVPALQQFFHFAPVGLKPVLLAIGIGFASVIWFEVVKWRKRIAK
jgi:Ca2+-transporting ATPase